MTHEHDLPSTFADVQECATELYAIITGQVQADYLEIAAHAYKLLGFVLYVLGADKERNPIGVSTENEMALQLTIEELRAIDDCMVACGHKNGPIVGGPLSAWALRVILAKAAEILLKLIADLIDGKETKAIEGIGDGTLLKILLENLPLIIEAIMKLLGK